MKENKMVYVIPLETQILTNIIQIDMHLCNRRRYTK